MAGQGSESRLVRPAARHGRGHGPGWRGAQPRPLTRQERPQPIGKGEEQGRSPLGLPPQPVGQVPTREALKPKRFQVKPEGREGGRRQTDEACSAHGRRPPAFSAKPCGGRVPMRLVLGPGRWSCDRGGWFSGPPGGACSMGRGGRRSRGNPKGVPLARFGRGKFSTASGGQLPVKNYRKNLTANLTGFGGVRFSVLGGVRFSVKIALGGVRFSVAGGSDSAWTTRTVHRLANMRQVLIRA